MNGTKRLLIGVLIGFVASGYAAEVAAQVCIGFPTARGQTAAAATIGFPAGGSDLGVEVGHHAPAGYSVFGGATRSRPDVGDDVTSIGGGAAFSIPELRAALPLGLGPRLYLGGTVNRVFVEEAASIFGIKVGLIF